MKTTFFKISESKPKTRVFSKEINQPSGMNRFAGTNYNYPKINSP